MATITPMVVERGIDDYYPKYKKIHVATDLKQVTAKRKVLVKKGFFFNKYAEEAYTVEFVSIITIKRKYSGYYEKEQRIIATAPDHEQKVVYWKYEK